MPTRTPKPCRDPLAEDRIERFFHRVGLGRVLGVSLGLAVAGTIALALAVSTLGVGVVAMEAISPTLPGRVLNFVDPAPSPTDRVARAAEPVPLVPATTVPTAHAPAAPTKAAPSTEATTMRARATPSGRAWAAIVTPSTPPTVATPTAPAPVQAATAAPARPSAVPPAPAATSAPAAAPTAAPAPAVAPSSTTPTTAPTTPAPSTSDDNGSGRHHRHRGGGCPRGQHKKGRC